MTKREFELLKYMMQNKNLVITREMILAKVWGYEYMGDTNVVDGIFDIFEVKLMTNLESS